MHWEHFKHGADIGVRGIGATQSEAFEQTALVLVAVIADLASVRTDTPILIRCAAPDVELLLIDWLNALIYSSIRSQERTSFGFRRSLVTFWTMN